MTQNQDLKMNNYQTVMSENDSLYQLNNTNFFLAFRIINKEISVFDKNDKRNLSKYFTFYSGYINGSFSNSLEVNSCNSIANNKVSQLNGRNDTMCLDFNNSNLGGNYFSDNNRKFVYSVLYFDYKSLMKDLNYSMDVLNRYLPL